jgi:muramidase (phage lysozyme)
MNAQTDAALLESAQASAETEREQVSPPSSEAASDKNATTPTFDINFLALDGSPISKMGVAVRWPGGEVLARTDADGAIPSVEAPPGETLSIAVQRFDGSYKKIGECCMPSSDGVLTAVSPNIVVETTTEKHEGKPGNAEERIPQPEQGDLGDLSAASKESGPNETVQPADEAETKRTETAKPAPADNDKPDQPPKPAPKPKASPRPAETKAKQQADKPPQHISGKAEIRPKLEKGRDENGNPLAVITQKAVDWWNSWRMPTFNLWGTPASSAKGGTVPVTPVKVDAEMVKKVEAFLAFAREQTEYLYTEGTAGVLASMGKGAFNHKKGEKESDKSRGLCYTYVKVALTRAKIIDGVLAAQKASAAQTDAEHYAMQLSASQAGPALIAKGFKDVTAEVPDARWAAAGDVIVYAWLDATWEKRKKKDPKSPNHGHIDIRDYDFYISDFIPKAKHPTWADYINLRIYRKVFDPLPTQRIRAFLRCIREFECLAEKDDSKRYQMLNAPLPSGERRFSSYKTHPWHGQGKPLKGSTAAGAYQILSGTWQEIFDKGLIELKGDRFSPTIQDRIAVMKLEDRGVLHLIRTGRIKEALEYKGPNGSLALPSEWTSLPGGKENAHRLTGDKKPMDMAYFQTLFDQYLNEEKAKG